MIATLNFFVIVSTFLCIFSTQTLAQEAKAAVWSEEVVEVGAKENIAVYSSINKISLSTTIVSSPDLSQDHSITSNTDPKKNRKRRPKSVNIKIKSISSKKPTSITLQNKRNKTLLEKLILKKRQDNLTVKRNTNDAKSIFSVIGSIFLILSFFLLVRLKLQTLWLFFIGLSVMLLAFVTYLVLLGEVTYLNRVKDMATGLAITIFAVLPFLIGAFIMLLGIFGYLGVVWQANALFNLLGFIFLGVSILIFTLLFLLAD
ncbi:MAG: hypothetical protein ACFB0B_02065 [Thermonemataceae bacterium]